MQMKRLVDCVDWQVEETAFACEQKSLRLEVQLRQVLGSLTTKVCPFSLKNCLVGVSLDGSPGVTSQAAAYGQFTLQEGTGYSINMWQPLGSSVD